MKIRYILKYTLLFSILTFQLNAFTQVISSISLETEPFSSVIQYSDNELIFIGTSELAGRYENAVTLTKRDLNGEVIWQKKIEMALNCTVKDAVILSDKNILILGGAREIPFKGYSFVLKTDSNGNKIWTKYFSTGQDAEKVIETDDGGCLFAYYSNGSHIMKLNEMGDSLWSNKVGIGRPYGLEETQEAVYLLVDDQNADIILTSIGNSGEVLWKLNFGGPGVDTPSDVLNAFNGDDYLFAGKYSSEKSGDDFFIGLIDCFGLIQWTKTFGGPGTDLCYDLMQASNGDFIAVGTSNSFSKNGDFEFFVVRIDNYGNAIWTKTFPGKEGIDYNALKAFETSKGSIIIAGKEMTTSNNTLETLLVEFNNPSSLDISFKADKKEFINPPYTVQFTNVTPNAAYYNFVWHFGDGETLEANDESVVHQYNDDGIYSVKLVAYENDFKTIDSLVFENYINCGVKSAITSTIDESLENKSINIHPNPFIGKTTITFDNPNNELFTLSIYSQTGKLVQKMDNIRGDSFELYRNNLPSGLYFIELSGSKSIKAKLLID